jgi:uncharacterized protein (TIGR03435 family)
MKKITLSILTLALSICASAQVKVGQNVPSFKFTTVLNSPVKKTNIEDFKGKVVILEFWATYCGPCITAMTHLQELQKQFKGKLQVITVSTEKEKRIKQFIATIPSNLWFAVDTADELRAVFPYHTIPHTVLIDGGGKVVAITEPVNITAKIITAVIAGKPINLSLKEDNMIEDPAKAYFSAADTVQSRLLIQPEIKGVSSMSRTYPTDSNFKKRRITLFNLPLEAIYRIAYNDQPYGRVLDLTPKENIKQNKTNYCIDLIVPKGHENELMPTLIKELQLRFDLKAAIEKRNKEVYLLKIADTAKIKQLKQSADKEETFGGSNGAFSGQSVKLSKIADYLEGFGLVKMPVVDETGLDVRYDIEFNYQPEKKGSLTDALTALGVKLEKGERDIDMLVFRQ